MTGTKGDAPNYEQCIVRSIFLNGSGNSQCTDSGSDAPLTGQRILRKGSSRNGDTSGNCCKFSGGLVVGIVGSGCKCSAVEGDGEIPKDWCELVGNDCARSGICGSVSAVLDQEGVGQSSVFRDRNRRNGFGNGKLRFRIGQDGFADIHRGDAVSGNGGGVGDRGSCGQRSKLVNDRFIDQSCVAAGRDSDAGDYKGWTFRHSRCGLKDTVDIVNGSPGEIGEWCQRSSAKGVGTQIIRDRKPRDGCSSGIDDADDIGDRIVGAVGVAHSGLGSRQNFQDFAYGNIRIGDSISIAELCLVRKSSHMICFLS